MDLFSSEWGPLACCCEHGNEPLGSVKFGEFLDKLQNYWHIRKKTPFHGVDLWSKISDLKFEVPDYYIPALNQAYFHAYNVDGIDINDVRLESYVITRAENDLLLSYTCIDISIRDVLSTVLL